MPARRADGTIQTTDSGKHKRSPNRNRSPSPGEERDFMAEDLHLLEEQEEVQQLHKLFVRETSTTRSNFVKHLVAEENARQVDVIRQKNADARKAAAEAEARRKETVKERVELERAKKKEGLRLREEEKAKKINETLSFKTELAQNRAVLADREKERLVDVQRRVAEAKELDKLLDSREAAADALERKDALEHRKEVAGLLQRTRGQREAALKARAEAIKAEVREAQEHKQQVPAPSTLRRNRRQPSFSTRAQ